MFFTKSYTEFLERLKALFFALDDLLIGIAQIRVLRLEYFTQTGSPGLAHNLRNLCLMLLVASPFVLPFSIALIMAGPCFIAWTKLDAFKKEGYHDQKIISKRKYRFFLVFLTIMFEFMNITNTWSLLNYSDTKHSVSFVIYTSFAGLLYLTPVLAEYYMCTKPLPKEKRECVLKRLRREAARHTHPQKR